MTFAFYGVGMDLQKFDISIFLVQILFGAMDIPAKLVGTCTIMWIGRRPTKSSVLILAGLMIIVNQFIPQDMQIFRTLLSALAKSCMACGLTCAYLYTMELYPTEIRQSALGFVNMTARVGSAAAPLILIIGEYVLFLPPLIFGSFALLSGIGTCFLMETRNRQLPETIQDVEDRKRKKTHLDQTLNSELIVLKQKEDSVHSSSTLNKI